MSAVGLMQALGPQAELNPIMRNLYVLAGPAGVIGAKTAVAGPIVLLLERAGRRGQERLARGILLAAAALGLVGVVSNVPVAPPP